MTIRLNLNFDRCRRSSARLFRLFGDLIFALRFRRARLAHLVVTTIGVGTGRHTSVRRSTASGRVARVDIVVAVVAELDDFGRSFFRGFRLLRFGFRRALRWRRRRQGYRLRRIRRRRHRLRVLRSAREADDKFGAQRRHNAGFRVNRVLKSRRRKVEFAFRYSSPHLNERRHLVVGFH